jgi:hypothetical protein
MKRHIALALPVLLAVVPLFAQVPKGWMFRSDHSTEASDPDAPGPIKLVPMGSGVRAIAPQAAIFWNPANTATGNYSLKGTFTLIQSTGYLEYYGLLFGGRDLAGPGQNYLYFVITDDGTWLIKRRTGTDTEELSEKTPSPAVKKPDASGRCTNTLEVRVTAGKIDFLINGTLVHTMNKAGQASNGIYGMRINHHLEVQVNGFGLSKS